MKELLHAKWDTLNTRLTHKQQNVWIRCQGVGDTAGSALPWPKPGKSRPEWPVSCTQELVKSGLCLCCLVTKLSPTPFQPSVLNYPGQQIKGKATCKVKIHQHLFLEKTTEKGEGRIRKTQLGDTKHTKTNAHYSAQCSTTFLATRITWINFLKENRLSQ